MVKKKMMKKIEWMKILENKLKDIQLGGIDVIILGKDDLFYQSPGLSQHKQINEETQDKSPINKPERYKQYLEFLKDDSFM